MPSPLTLDALEMRANVAWMRWHLGGENFRKDEFLGDGGDYNDTGIWVTDFKNWDDWKNWNE